MENSGLPGDEAASIVNQALEKALACQRQGLIKEAEALYRSVLQVFPAHPEANHNLGVLTMQMATSVAALPYFMAALEADPSRGLFWLSYIDALIQAGELSTAREALEYAKAQGLQGEEVDALARELDGGRETPAFPAAGHRSAQPEEDEKKSHRLSAQEGRRPAGRRPDPRDEKRLLELFSEGQYEAVVELALAMVERFPRAGTGWKLLGASYQQLGRPGDALLPMRKAAPLLPGDAAVHSNLGVILDDLGLSEEAVVSYRRALKIRPDYAIALSNLGNSLHELGRLEEAEASYRRALRANPGSAETPNNLGVILQELGRLDEAEASYRRALQVRPDFAEAHSNLGRALHESGRLEEAEASYRQALEIEPGHAIAHNNLGITLHELGRMEEAEASYRNALNRSSDYAEAYNNLGSVLRDRGRQDEALECFLRALHNKPKFVEARFNLGAILHDLGRSGEAIENFRKALELNPGYWRARASLGAVLKDQGRLPEAIEVLRGVLCGKPDLADAWNYLLFALGHCESSRVDEIFAEHCRYGQQFESVLRPEWPISVANSREEGRTLRVGFVSGDLFLHAVTNFIGPILGHLACCSGLELYAYYNHAVEDEMTRQLKTSFAQWRVVAGMSDDALARNIRADGIDILIDLSGHTGRNRLLTFARRAAPVQASWIGYPGTTGLMSMDYYLGDRYFLPPGMFDAYFTEKIVRLPALAPFLPERDAPAVNELPALKKGYLTFGSVNRINKISRTVVTLWSRILRALPDARMVLGGMPTDGEPTELLGWFAEEGVARERLTLYGRTDILSYLGQHGEVDMCLDTYPYNGGTTTQHALWMGVPTLTLVGETVTGRVGAMNLGHQGLDEFITHDAEEFVGRGVEWAGRLEALAQLRCGMRERFAKSAPGRPELIASGLEQALRIMWRRWCQGLPPESFEVCVADLPLSRAVELGCSE